MLRLSSVCDQYVLPFTVKMIFERDNLKNKKNFYLILILIEIGCYILLFYASIHWFFLVLTFPFLCIELISNQRCLKRQKNFIKSIEFNEDELTCNHFNTSKSSINYNDLIFSFREIKFEKDKSEIEIKRKGKFRNRLIGRIHIDYWKDIIAIKNQFLDKNIIRVKFKPEGFWSKYGGITADVIITSTGLVVGEVADLSGDVSGGMEARYVSSQSNFESLHKDHNIKKTK